MSDEESLVNKEIEGAIEAPSAEQQSAPAIKRRRVPGRYAKKPVSSQGSKEKTEDAAGSGEETPISKSRRRSRKKQPLPPVIVPVNEIIVSVDQAQLDGQTNVLEAEVAAPMVESPVQPIEKPRRRPRRRKPQTPVEEPCLAPQIPETKPGRGQESAVRRKKKPAIGFVSKPGGAKLVIRNEVPQIQIERALHPPVLFFGNLDSRGNEGRILSQVQKAARAGVHFHSTLLEIPVPASDSNDFFAVVDRRLKKLLEGDPGGYVMPRVVFKPAPGWRRSHFREFSVHNEQTGDPSLGSDLFWEAAERSLAGLLDHFNASDYGSRVFGIHLERGEWFLAKEDGFDHSDVNREAFRGWLAAKYHNDVIELRAAWYDGEVQFSTADIPSPSPATGPERFFLEQRRNRRLLDFYAFTSELMVQRILGLAQVIKQKTFNRMLTSVCYGYTFEFAHPHSGHRALQQLLDSPAIDIVAGPPGYRQSRSLGGSAAYPTPVGSVRLHRKLWISEEDIKTDLAAEGGDDDYNVRFLTRSDTESAHRRGFGQALANAAGIGWMDLWGEGWLDDPSYWEKMSEFIKYYRSALKACSGSYAQVIALIDERSLNHINCDESRVKEILGQRSALIRTGASVSFHLQSDVTHPNFPLDAKLYIFLNAYRLTQEERSAIIERLHGGGRTLAWIGPVGTCSDRGETAENVSDVIGMSLRPQEWNSECGSRVVDSRHPVTARLRRRELGNRERRNPSFSVVDDDATPLAVYQQSGAVSIAARTHSDWRSVFCSELALSIEWFQGLCRYANVHLFTSGESDVVYADGGWLTIHADRPGTRIISLPPSEGEQNELYDLVAKRLVPTDGHTARVTARHGATLQYYFGPLSKMRTLGFINLSVSPSVKSPRNKAPNRPETPQTGTEPEPNDAP
ncbi:MAG: beta-galactosidase [Armatimonadetes bacterium]|nr:beta-galactosidase [Armatimonadota bacterium]